MIVRIAVTLNILAILAIMLVDMAGGGLSPLNIAVGTGLITLHGAFLCFWRRHAQT